MLTLKEALSKIDAEKGELFLYRSLVARECPKTMKALGLLDAEYTLSRRPKGYNLVKRDNKRLGIVYYVRYWHEGRMIPSKWCTGTNDPGEAGRFAEKNRAALIEAYTKKTTIRRSVFSRGFSGAFLTTIPQPAGATWRGKGNCPRRGGRGTRR